jgi:hypothetical protein
MIVIQVFVGAGLLVFGRKLFWFLVAGFGFIAGLELATRYLQGSPGWVTLLVALGAGLVGALLAVFLEQAAIALAGFFGGGYVLTSLIDLLGIRFTRPEWLVPLVGGMIGVVLVFSLLNWTLIALSSLAGASLVTQAFQLPRPEGPLVYLLLLVAGIVIQGNLLRREGRPARK